MSGTPLVEGTACSRSAKACSRCFHGSLNREESEGRSGTGEREAAEEAASGWWVGSFEVSRADPGAFLLWDPLDPDGRT